MINNHKGIKMEALTLLNVKKMIKPLVWKSEVKNQYEASIGYFYFTIEKYDHKDFRLCIRDDFGSRQYASLKEAKAEVNKFLVSTVCTILGVKEND